tara:strand:+ start:140 stop:622 length:483 start_codon:yes stop_codon:yes gene_type:complete
MALKGDRYELETDVSHFMSDTTAERGGIASLSTAGSGASLDQSAALVTYAAAATGVVPVGILLNDMVNIDQTRQHINFHKNEVQTGGKVTLLRKGWVVTNRIDPGDTIAGGDPAYVGPSGFISNDNALGGRIIGNWASLADEDGYAKVNVNLPQFDDNQA